MAMCGHMVSLRLIFLPNIWGGWRMPCSLRPVDSSSAFQRPQYCGSRSHRLRTLRLIPWKDWIYEDTLVFVYSIKTPAPTQIMVAKLTAPAAITPIQPSGRGASFRRNIAEYETISRAMLTVPASHSQAAAPLGHVVLQHTTHLSTIFFSY